MNVEGVKITWIFSPEEEFQQQERAGFVPVCRYGIGMPMERNELGCIGRPVRGNIPMKTPFDPLGMFTVKITVLERIFIVTPGEPT